jgi:two-component system, OmpR family, response regulator RegX3
VSTVPQFRVLVVEDEESFVEALTLGLSREGFRVDVARDGAEALELIDDVRPDVVLLDLMLPKISGLDVCRQIRTRSSVPIIMVTARDSEVDAVVGLEVGADDYVTKPYRLRELVARMRAVLRRAAPGVDDGAPSGEAIEVGDVRLDPERHEVVVRGDEVALPLREFELLELLLSNAGRVMTRDILIDRIWGPDYVGDTKTLDVHIKRLRSRIEDDPSQPKRITTIRGLGYRYEKAPAGRPQPLRDGTSVTETRPT